MTGELKSVNLKVVLEAVSTDEKINFRDDFFIMRIKDGQNLDFLNNPFRVDSYFAVYCESGSVEAEINLRRFTLNPGSVLISLPGSIVRVVNPVKEGHSNGEFAVVALSRVFLGGMVDKKAASGPQDKSSENRSKRLFENFLNLVSRHHASERGMAFYAERLGLTPKYLSKLIKQVSGRSAPDWIDDFVIVEAKNLLKYSNDSIKEIVYKLHFSNASVFYKYFKAHTGMTPTEFRRESAS